MIEFVSSKVVGTIVALALLGSVMGFFGLQRSALEEQHFRDMQGNLVRLIDGVSASCSECTINVTFGDGRTGLRLDFSFRNKGYEIELWPGQVIFRQGGLTVAGGLIQPVHLWNPKLLGKGTDPATSYETIQDLDRNNPVLGVPSGKDFMVESRPVMISGEVSFQTFVHF